MIFACTSSMWPHAQTSSSAPPLPEAQSTSLTRVPCRNKSSRVFVHDSAVRSFRYTDGVLARLSNHLW